MYNTPGGFGSPLTFLCSTTARLRVRWRRWRFKVRNKKKHIHSTNCAAVKNSLERTNQRIACILIPCHPRFGMFLHTGHLPFSSIAHDSHLYILFNSAACVSNTCWCTLDSTARYTMKTRWYGKLQLAEMTCCAQHLAPIFFAQQQITLCCRLRSEKLLLICFCFNRTITAMVLYRHARWKCVGLISCVHLGESP